VGVVLFFQDYLQDLRSKEKQDAVGRLETAIANHPALLRTLLHLPATPEHTQVERERMRAALLNELVREGWEAAWIKKPNLLKDGAPQPPRIARSATAPSMGPSRPDAQLAQLRLAGFPPDQPLVEIEGPLAPFGQGKFNVVYATSILDGAMPVIVKPLEPRSIRGVARSMGLESPPHFEHRNLASFELARFMGLRVICVTTLGVVTAPGELENRLVIVMERVNGRALAHLESKRFNDPDLREQLTALQLLDAVLGQGDRHGGNIIVNMNGEEGRAEVVGIDNDQCLGPLPLDPDQLPGMQYSRAVRLPPSITREVAERFRKLTGADLRELLRPHVRVEEAEAAVARLDRVHQHIDTCEREGRLVDHLAYDTLHTPENSYWARGRLHAVDRETHRRPQHAMRPRPRLSPPRPDASS
jgi:hypothetical protein